MPERQEIESPTSEQILQSLKEGAEIYTAITETFIADFILSKIKKQVVLFPISFF